MTKEKRSVCTRDFRTVSGIRREHRMFQYNLRVLCCKVLSSVRATLLPTQMLGGTAAKGAVLTINCPNSSLLVGGHQLRACVSQETLWPLDLLISGVITVWLVRESNFSFGTVLDCCC
eukprot:3669357-Pyramimonas_sp.AAC.2